MKKKICIIGAGPAGSYSGYLLAKKGFDVTIYEQKKKIGKIQCGGALTATIAKIDEIFRSKEFKKIVVNRIAGTKFNSPDNVLVVKFKNLEYVVDRIKFDNFLANKARKAGAKIKLGCKFLEIKEKNDKIKFIVEKGNKKEIIETDVLIGADGVYSRVCKCLGIKRNLELAIEARCKGRFNKNSYEIFLGREYGKFYAWIIPESETIARIGLSNNINNFKKFIKNLKVKILDMRSGFVPVDKPCKCMQKNIYLVGDAGCTVKATTGGGIVPSLHAAKILAESIIKNENFNKCIKNCRRDLYLHHIARKILNKFNDKDYDELLEIAKKDKKLRKFLEQGSRDEITLHNFPLSFKLLKFAKKIL